MEYDKSTVKAFKQGFIKMEEDVFHFLKDESANQNEALTNGWPSVTMIGWNLAHCHYSIELWSQNQTKCVWFCWSSSNEIRMTRFSVIGTTVICENRRNFSSRARAFTSAHALSAFSGLVPYRGRTRALGELKGCLISKEIQ